MCVCEFTIDRVERKCWVQRPKDIFLNGLHEAIRERGRGGVGGGGEMGGSDRDRARDKHTETKTGRVRDYMQLSACMGACIMPERATHRQKEWGWGWRGRGNKHTETEHTDGPSYCAEPSVLS